MLYTNCQCQDSNSGSLTAESIKKPGSSKCWQVVEEKAWSWIAGGSDKWYNTLENNLSVSYTYDSTILLEILISKKWNICLQIFVDKNVKKSRWHDTPGSETNNFSWPNMQHKYQHVCIIFPAYHHTKI